MKNDHFMKTILHLIKMINIKIILITALTTILVVSLPLVMTERNM